MTAIAVWPGENIESFPRRAPAVQEPQELYVQGSFRGADIKSIFKTMLVDELRALRHLQPGWDSYSAPIPNETAIENVSRVLELSDARALMRARILPSAEGGVGICFTNGDRYADLECSNDGDILGVWYVGNQQPTLIQAESTEPSILAALQEIRAHVLG